ncbi:hypothetical protein TWF730_002257 [Orbilia blumenaviensis]|uniref:Uncharacterized protein n=1 Tax=Orbilia blumenaviensis TaxID=1796055 RepID=A0AAV9UDS3_9PEZI
MVIYTPRLCSDAAFQPPAESRANQIECLEVMNEERIREYRAEKERREKNLQALLEMVESEKKELEFGKLPSGGGVGGGWGMMGRSIRRNRIIRFEAKGRRREGRMMILSSLRGRMVGRRWSW